MLAGECHGTSLGIREVETTSSSTFTCGINSGFEEESVSQINGNRLRIWQSQQQREVETERGTTDTMSPIAMRKRVVLRKYT